MKNLLIVLAIGAVLSIAGCSKDLPLCERQNWGILKLVNSSSQDVRVYVDGEYTTDVYINSYIEVDHIPAGTHYVHAEQLSTGRSWDNTVVIFQCDRLNVAFVP
jgi:hypothetical protein